MLLSQIKYVSAVVLPMSMLMILGCGGGGGSSSDPTLPLSYNISGKISLESTAGPVSGVTVTLCSTSFSVYSLPDAPDRFGATVTIAATGRNVQTDLTGIYSFTGVPAGTYTIRPSSASYVFNPDKTGAITITDSNTVYVYNPETLGNSLIGNVIYNSSFSITNNMITEQNFRASPPGGVNQ